MTRAHRRKDDPSPAVPDHLLVPGGGSWRDHGSCINHPTLPPAAWDDAPDTWPFAGEQAPARERRTHDAKLVCNACPVRLPCMRDVDLRYDEGVRGGVDLRDLRDRRRYA